MRRTRGLLLWALIGAVIGVVVWRRGAARGLPPVEPGWAPAPVDPSPAAETPQVVDVVEVVETVEVVEVVEVVEPVETVGWVEAVDGDAPASHPIKVASSGIYHVPGGRFYARTVPTRCYATAEDAEADGYRRAKA